MTMKVLIRDQQEVIGFVSGNFRSKRWVSANIQFRLKDSRTFSEYQKPSRILLVLAWKTNTQSIIF